MELEHNELCEKLHLMKIKIEVLEREVAQKQLALLEAKIRATEAEKEHFLFHEGCRTLPSNFDSHEGTTSKRC